MALEMVSKFPQPRLKGNTLILFFLTTKVYHEATLETNAGPQDTDMFWKIMPREQEEGTSMETTTEQGEISDTDEVLTFPSQKQKQLFFSPVEGCTRSFQYEKNLAKHVILGKHKYWNERETAVGFAQKNYALALGRSNLQAIRKAQQALVASVPAEGVTLDMGWALKTSPIVTPFTDKQKTYMIRKFEDGAAKRNFSIFQLSNI